MNYLILYVCYKHNPSFFQINPNLQLINKIKKAINNLNDSTKTYSFHPSKMLSSPYPFLEHELMWCQCNTSSDIEFVVVVDCPHPLLHFQPIL